MRTSAPNRATLSQRVDSPAVHQGLPPPQFPEAARPRPQALPVKPEKLADFGWRFRGRPVRVLEDHSFKLESTRERTAFLLPYCSDGDSLMSCLQCGMCTARCNLAETGSLFPRRQMTFVQLGQRESLLADQSIWLCFNCTDCSAGCPAKARPGRIMAAARLWAIEHYSTPRFLARLANAPKAYPWLFFVAALFLLAAIAIGGSFSPATTSVHYASMLPHLTLNILFSGVAGYALISALIGVGRAWKAFVGEPIWRADLRSLLLAAREAGREILTHRGFSKCQQYPFSRWAHSAVLYGFLTLFALAGCAALLILIGAPYPFPALHPLKIAGNLGAAAVVVGSLYFLWQRYRGSGNGDPSSWFDWALLWNLLLLSVTGILAETFRYANLARAAYPTYFIHLLFAFVLLAGLSYSKLAHGIYRALALAAREYGALAESRRAYTDHRRVAA